MTDETGVKDVPAEFLLQLEHDRALLPTPDQLHGAACALFEQEHGDHAAQDKPFTAAVGRAPHATMLRLTWLSDVSPPALTCVPTVRLGGATARVADLHVTTVTYEALHATSPGRTASLSFRSPLMFRRDGRVVPLPDPVLILQSLGRRWNQFAPAELAVTPDVLADLRRQVHLRSFEGRTETALHVHGTATTGFVGDATLGLPATVAQSSAHALAVLCAAAPFLGCGASTTRGFGLVAVA